MEIPTGPMQSAVAESLTRMTKRDGRDKATETLALTYAALIDDAAPAGRYARPLAELRVLVELAEMPAAGDALDRIEVALGEHSVMSDLGPKLLTALESLGMTPRARGGAEGSESRDESGPLDELEQQRDRRMARLREQSA